MSDVANTIKAYIVDNFLFGDEFGLSDSASFLDAGIIDSTGILELIAFIEGAFNLKIHDEELIPENLDSIANLQAFISRKSGTP